MKLKFCQSCGICPEKDLYPNVAAIWLSNPRAKTNLGEMTESELYEHILLDLKSLII